MIPILYTADETRFITNGVGRLADCTRAVVTEERNGIFELEFDYPLTGAHFDEIELGRIVACTHDDRHDLQPFVIYRRTVPDLNGIVTFNAHHISYRLNKVAVMPFSAGSVAAALQGIAENSVNANPFTFWTDKSTVASYNSEVPRMARAMLGGEENSILDVFGGGEYEFDRFEVKLYANRGQDTDVEIRYSKNLTDLDETIDNSDVYNAIVPFWRDSEGNIVTLPEKLLVYSGIERQRAYLTDHNLIIIRTHTGERLEVRYTEINAVPMDLSDTFEEMPTPEQLRAAARTRFESSKAWLPSENLTVDFVQLWQTEEFKEYSALQRVSLCDTVSVYYPQAGIAKVKQKVVKVVYNVLLDRYDEIELGQVSASLGQAIRENIMQSVPTTSMMDAAIKYATDLIRGGLGGYVVMTPGPNGYPQEILIMDTPDVNTAVNVWRFNQGGLGHSSNGYEGPFDDIALTQDGKINASMITAGILNANLIRAGIIQDAEGQNYWNLESGEFSTKKGYIADWTINRGELTYAPRANRKTSLSGQNGFSSYYCEQYTESFYNKYYLSRGFRLGNAYNGARLEFLGAVDTTPQTTQPGKVFTFGIHEFYGGLQGIPYHELRVEDGEGNNILDLSKTNIHFAKNSQFMEDVYVTGDVTINHNFTVYGTKSRQSKTDNYSDRLLYCYETPTPLFGDIGEATIDEDGFAYVDIDDIFSETVASRVEYQVFLQAEGEGACYIAEKHPNYFVIKGTPNLKVAWELKAKQRDYENIRLEQSDTGLEEYANESADLSDIELYIKEQEELLYDNN